MVPCSHFRRNLTARTVSGSRDKTTHIYGPVLLQWPSITLLKLNLSIRDEIISSSNKEVLIWTKTTDYGQTAQKLLNLHFRAFWTFWALHFCFWIWRSLNDEDDPLNIGQQLLCNKRRKPNVLNYAYLCLTSMYVMLTSLHWFHRQIMSYWHLSSLRDDPMMLSRKLEWCQKRQLHVFYSLTVVSKF